MTTQASTNSAASAQEAEAARTMNIIDTALDFTLMKWLFQKGSTPKILQRLEDTFAGFEGFGSRRTTISCTENYAPGLRRTLTGYRRRSLCETWPCAFVLS